MGRPLGFLHLDDYNLTLLNPKIYNSERLDAYGHLGFSEEAELG